MGFEGTVLAVNRQIVAAGDMGYVTCLESGPGMSLAGEPIRVEIRSTTIFRREEGQWRAVHHHTDRFN